MKTSLRDLPKENSTNIKDIIFPQKFDHVSLAQDKLDHDLYRKTHSSYYPGEQITRNYTKHFDKGVRYGEKGGAGSSVDQVKKVLTWKGNQTTKLVKYSALDKTHNEINVDASANEKQYKNRAHRRFDILRNELLSDNVTNMLDGLKYINTLRMKLKKRIPKISYIDIYAELFFLDKNNTGVLSKETVYDTLYKHYLFVNIPLFESFLIAARILENGYIDYQKTINALNWNCEYPLLQKIDGTTASKDQFATTYNCFFRSIANEKKNYSNICHLLSKKRESAFELIFPSAFTELGLSELEFYKTRSKNEIYTIFTNIGIEFPDNLFDKYWNEILLNNSVNGISIKLFLKFLSNKDYQNLNYSKEK